MSFLFRFSKYVTVPILLDWLTLVDLASLESSCSKKDSLLLREWMQVHCILGTKVAPRLASLYSGLLPWAARFSLNISECLFVLDETTYNVYKASDSTMVKNNVVKVVLKSSVNWKALASCIAPIISLENLMEFYFEEGPPKIFEIITTDCRRLRKCYITNYEHSEDIFSPLCRNCTELTELSYISQSYARRPGILMAITVHSRNLQYLALSPAIVDEKEWYLFAFHCRAPLASLVLTGLGTGTALREILVFQGSSLSTLHLPMSYNRYPMVNIHEYSSGLTCLDVGASFLDASSMVELLTQLPLLTSLTAPKDHGLEEDHYEIIGESCKQLRIWGDVEYGMAISESSIRALSQLGSTLTSLNMIKKYLTDESVKCIANHCSLLTELYLASNKNLTDASIVPLAQSCTRLTVLDLNMCDYVPGSKKGSAAISDLSGKAISRHCCNLIVLNMMGCSLTDLGAVLLCELKAALRLSLDGNGHISEAVQRAVKGRNSANEKRYDRYLLAKKYCKNV